MEFNNNMRMNKINGLRIILLALILLFIPFANAQIDSLLYEDYSTSEWCDTCFVFIEPISLGQIDSLTVTSFNQEEQSAEETGSGIFTCVSGTNEIKTSGEYILDCNDKELAIRGDNIKIIGGVSGEISVHGKGFEISGGTISGQTNGLRVVRDGEATISGNVKITGKVGVEVDFGAEATILGNAKITGDGGTGVFAMGHVNILGGTIEGRRESVLVGKTARINKEAAIYETTGRGVISWLPDAITGTANYVMYKRVGNDHYWTNDVDFLKGRGIIIEEETGSLPVNFICGSGTNEIKTSGEYILDCKDKELAIRGDDIKIIGGVSGEITVYGRGVEISGGTISGGVQGVWVSGGAEATILGNAKITGNYGVLVNSGGEVTISGNANIIGWDIGVFVSNGGDVKILGGTISGNDAILTHGTAKINKEAILDGTVISARNDPNTITGTANYVMYTKLSGDYHWSNDVDFLKGRGITIEGETVNEAYLKLTDEEKKALLKEILKKDEDELTDLELVIFLAEMRKPLDEMLGVEEKPTGSIEFPKGIYSGQTTPQKFPIDITVSADGIYAFKLTSIRKEGDPGAGFDGVLCKWDYEFKKGTTTFEYVPNKQDADKTLNPCVKTGSTLIGHKFKSGRDYLFSLFFQKSDGNFENIVSDTIIYTESTEETVENLPVNIFTPGENFKFDKSSAIRDLGGGLYEIGTTEEGVSAIYDEKGTHDDTETPTVYVVLPDASSTIKRYYLSYKDAPYKYNFHWSAAFQADWPTEVKEAFYKINKKEDEQQQDKDSLFNLLKDKYTKGIENPDLEKYENFIIDELRKTASNRHSIINKEGKKFNLHFDDWKNLEAGDKINVVFIHENLIWYDLVTEDVTAEEAKQIKVDIDLLVTKMKSGTEAEQAMSVLELMNKLEKMEESQRVIEVFNIMEELKK